MRTGKKAVFACVTTVGFLLLLELGSRLILPTPLPAARDDGLVTQDTLFARTRLADPHLFWKLRPGIDLLPYGHTNSLGLRGREVVAKQPGVYRILSLGESTTFGRHIPFESTYSRVLERALASEDGPRVEVINGGVPGYSLFQGVMYLRHHGLALEPDAVLLYFGYNDFLPVAYRVTRERALGNPDAGLTDAEAYARSRERLPRFVGSLLAASNVVRVLASVGREREDAAGSAPSEVVTNTAKVRVPAADRLRLLEEAAALCRERGVSLFVAVPWYRSFDAHVPLLRAFSRRRGVPLVDLPAELAALPGARETYFIDEAHPTALGHEQIGSALARALRPQLARFSEGQVPPSEGPVPPAGVPRRSP